MQSAYSADSCAYNPDGVADIVRRVWWRGVHLLLPGDAVAGWRRCPLTPSSITRRNANSATIPRESVPNCCWKECAGRHIHSKNNAGALCPPGKGGTRQTPVNIGRNNIGPTGTEFRENRGASPRNKPSPLCVGPLFRSAKSKITAYIGYSGQKKNPQNRNSESLFPLLAEGGGFEPPVRVYPVRRFSKPLPSATQPSLQTVI